MHKPSVSVIVPVYNVEPYVAACVRSVMRQTYEGKIECIFVDDCGTDKSIDVVEKLIAEYSGPIAFKIIHATHNQGPSVARNIGMDAATCEYLYFLDGDDEIYVGNAAKTKAKKILRILQDKQPEITGELYGGRYWKMEDSGYVNNDWSEDLTVRVYLTYQED